MTARSVGPASLVRLLGSWRGQGATYRSLADGLRLLVLDGRLPLDARLPGERDLAASLGISRTTVAAALAVLREQGYVTSRHGSGSRTRLPAAPGERSSEALTGLDTDPATLDLAAAAMPASEAVHAAYAAALAALPAHLPGHGYEPVGLPVLREAVAERYTRRGLPTAPEQVLVTHGAQHAFALLLRLLAAPGDRVLVEHPTYPHAIDAVLRASCRIVPVGLPATGWDVDGMAAAMRQTGPRLAYFVPDFHNPTGRCMDAATRAAVAAAGRQTRTVLVVDETMVDLWLDGPPPPPLAVHDRGGTVVTLGSTGKSFWGGLRVGWVRADAATIAALAAVRASLDLGTPVLEQLAVASLLAGEEAILERRRAVLRDRRDLLVRLVREQLPDWRVEPPPGGVALWAELPVAASTALAAASERYGVRLAAGPRFGVDGAFERFVRLPYTRPDDELTEAVARLARAWADVRPGSGRPTRGAGAPEAMAV